jgi:hypothetical protein
VAYERVKPTYITNGETDIWFVQYIADVKVKVIIVINVM